MSNHRQSSTGYRFQDGDLTRFEISENGYEPAELAGRQCNDRSVQMLLRGQQHDGFEGILPELVELAARITPGMTWYAAPEFGGGCGGRAFNSVENASPKNVAFLMSWEPRFAIGVLYHEAAHNLERLLTEDEMAALNDAVARGTGFACSEADSFIERRADLVKQFCLFLRSGGRVYGGPEAPENDVMLAIYDGVIGARRNLRQEICAPVAIAKRPISSRIAAYLGLEDFGRWLETPAG